MNDQLKSPFVSVVITCYNLGRYIVEAIDSVKAQTYTNWEIIVINDGSTDEKTLQVLKKIKTEPKLRVVFQRNTGLSIARNNGIILATGDYVVCLDADDILSPQYLEKTVNVLSNSGSKVAFVSTWIQEFGKRNSLWKAGLYDQFSLLISNRVCVAALFKKSIWEGVGGYKKEMKGGYEDWEFWLSITEKGYEWAVVQEPLFNYRVRENSMLATATQKRLELCERLFDLHKDFYSKFQKQIFLQYIALDQETKSLISMQEKLLMKREYELGKYKQLNQQLTRELHRLRSFKPIKMALWLRKRLIAIANGIKLS